MLGDADVYEGLWEKYNQPLFQRWKWTLGNLNGFLVLGCVGILLTFSQSRAWMILRYLVHLRKQPIRLDDDSHSDPLEHLSQMHAIKDFITFIRDLLWRLFYLARRKFKKDLRSEDRRLHRDSSVISPLFGVAALINSALFIAMGIAIPCLLSEGVLEAPLVKSKMNERCVGDANMFRDVDPHDTDAVYKLCNAYSILDPACGSQLLIRNPQISKRRLNICPFPGNICYNDTDSVEITHGNITGYELGINTKSRVTINHRLICSPVHLESFLLHNIGPRHVTNISVRDVGFNGDLYLQNVVLPRYNMTLNTLNGPNRFSNEYSGHRKFLEVRLSDLTVLPDLDERSLNTYNAAMPKLYNSIIHPDLRRDDGISFLAIYRAGSRRASFVSPVDDPFYAAHMKCGDWYPRYYCTDHEATALGCLDQSQYCSSASDFCTSWGSGVEVFQTMRRELELQEDVTSTADMWAFGIARDSLSIHNYLRIRQRRSFEKNGDALVPLNAIESNRFLRPLPSIARDQWVAEVETWFMRAIIEAILEVQLGPRLNSAFNRSVHRPEDLDTEHLTCHRILFRNANYTNINWAELWLTICLLVLVCATSYLVKGLGGKTRAIVKGIARFINFLGKGLILAARGLKSLMLDRQRENYSWRVERMSRYWAWFFDKRQTVARKTELTRHGFRGSIRGSNFDDSEVGSASVSLEQLGGR